MYSNTISQHWRTNNFPEQHRFLQIINTYEYCVHVPANDAEVPLEMLKFNILPPTCIISITHL